ncbi:leukotriene B4 receptor 1-like [Lissotriton helveticus]
MEDAGNNPSVSSGLWVEHVLVPSLFLGACFLVGVPGNAFVIWTILWKIKERTLTLVLILNLAIADLVVLITLPLWIHSLASEWLYGLFACKLLTYAIYCTMYASVFLLTLMSIQRFTVVVYPFTARGWQRRNTMFGVVLAIWVIAIGFSSPVFLFRSTVEINGTLACNTWVYASDTQKITNLLVQLLISFVIPFLTLIVCYTLILRRLRRLKFKGKSKPGKLIVSMIIAFFVCWFPYHMVNVLIVSAILLRSSSPETARALEHTVKTGENISGALAFLSSCLNPVLYAFAARSFQGGLRGTNFAKLFGQMDEEIVEKNTKESHISSVATDVHLQDV